MSAAHDKIMLFLDPRNQEKSTDGCIDYPDSERDMMRVLDTLAAFDLRKANKEKDREKKRELFTQAKKCYDDGDKLLPLVRLDERGFDPSHVIGKAYFCLLQGDNADQAESHFNFLLNHTAPQER